MTTAKITIRGRNGQIIFFDDKDRKKFSDICGYLPDHLSNDLRTWERCGGPPRLTSRSPRPLYISKPGIGHLNALLTFSAFVTIHICACAISAQVHKPTMKLD